MQGTVQSNGYALQLLEEAVLLSQVLTPPLPQGISISGHNIFPDIPDAILQMAPKQWLL